MPRIDAKEAKRRWQRILAADFIAEHLYDRYFDIGGEMKDGWVMRHAMDLIESSEGEIQLPRAWLPSNLRGRALAESYAWKNNLCDSVYPNQDI